jgi:phage/plasmid-like protein (TIGR03299 family)
MAHELNELAPGIHSFASAKLDAWHRLGTVVDDAMNAEHALAAAHLAGWNVRKTQIFARDEHGNEVAIGNRFATIYTNPISNASTYLGVVGGHYTPIQNEAHADLLDAIVDESGAHFETAGSLRGGRETFITMKMPETMLIGGKDAVDMYLIGLNSHDGTSSFRFMISPVRVVCANTQAAALRSAVSSFSVRHNGIASSRLQEAREALSMTWKYAEEFELSAQMMIEKSISDRAFDKITAQLFGGATATTARAKNVVDEHRAGVSAIWNSDGDTMRGMHGNRWGAYQAITEYIDHNMGVRSTGDSADVARARRVVTSKSVQSIKETAFSALSRSVLKV